MMALLVVFLGSIAVLNFERTSHDALIESPEDALWWALATVTGVGYGDFYPVTSGGRVVGAFTMILGLALFAILASLLTAWFLAPQEAAQDQELESIRGCLSDIELHLKDLSSRVSLLSLTVDRPVSSNEQADPQLSEMITLLREMKEFHEHSLEATNPADTETSRAMEDASDVASHMAAAAASKTANV